MYYLQRRTKRTDSCFLALAILVGSCPSAVGQESAPDASSSHEPALADVPAPMASFARLVGGEWQVTFASGEAGYQAWHWGPGRYSVRTVTPESAPEVNPWAGEVYYWHPGRGQVCHLSLHGDIPGVGRGVSEGTIQFDGETANAVFDLYQPAGSRKMGSRWVFDGRDKYRDTLLEDTGAGLEPMNGWTFIRIAERGKAPSHAGDAARPQLSKEMKAFEQLVGHSWETQDHGEHPTATESALSLRSTYEWVTSLEAVCARLTAPGKQGEPAQKLEAYFYHHVGADVIRCLALSSEGSVYEGDVTVIDGGALQLDLKGYEGDQVVPYLVQLDFERDGSLRNRIWSHQDGERTLRLDVSQQKAPMDNHRP